MPPSTAGPTLRVCNRRRVTRLVSLAALLWLLAPSASAAPDSPFELPAFLAKIDTILARLDSADASSLQAVGQSIPVRERVRGNGFEIEVTFVWIHHALEDVRARRASWTSVRPMIRERLAAIRREVTDALSQPAESARDDASQALSRVLARDEFRQASSERAFARLRRWIGDQFDRLWQMLGGNRVDRRALAVVLSWIAGIAALVTMGSIFVRMLVKRSDYTRLSAAPGRPRRQPARAWALRARAAEDPREVARCAYRAAIVRLEEEGAWRADDARTPREHLRLLSPDHRRLPAMRDIAIRFEQIWFAARPASADDTQNFLTRLRELGCLQPSE